MNERRDLELDGSRKLMSNRRGRRGSAQAGGARAD